MRVRITRAVYLGGQVVPVGSEHDLVDALAREVIAAGKAERVSGAPAAPVGPMTTETAAPVVRGKKAKEPQDAGQSSPGM